MSAATKFWKQEIAIEEIQKTTERQKKTRDVSREAKPEQKHRHHESQRDLKNSSHRHRERSEDRRRERNYKDRSRERYRERSRERMRERSRDRPYDRPIERSREQFRDRSRERFTERPRERSRERARERSRSKERARERSRSRGASRDYDRSRSRATSRDYDGKRMKLHHFTEEIDAPELPIEPIPEISVETKRESIQNADEIDEFQQGNIEDASKAAAKATQEMDEKIRERRERMLAWRKERKDTKDEKPIVQKTFNLDDDEDDSNAVHDADQYLEIVPLSEDVLSLLNASPEKESQQPTRTAVLSGKKVKGKKNAIVFGLKKREQPLKRILKPSVLTQFNVGDQEEESERPVQKMVEAKEDIAETIEKLEVTEEVDPLDSFMVDIHFQVDEKAELDKSLNANQKKVKPELLARVLKDIPSDAEEDNEEEINPLPLTGPINTAVEINQADIFAAAAARSLAKKKELPVVDHEKVTYEPFRKDFFMEPPDVASWTPEMVEQKRMDLDGIQVRGKNCPKPIEKWSQFGMPNGIHEVIKKVLKYEIPTPIQAQAIPAIMSGRDVIGIAKTGSGKTIAFLLPMFRHIKDQRPSQGQEGPIGLVMTPTRELALQIFRECKHFSKILGLRVSCCYGGAPIRDQIADLKRGAEIIICTPGRMIDLLCANGGRVTNLKRVSYLVLDEADRMFDLGFEPQVMRMVMNTRPDRQTVLFSATFPRFMEALARKILHKPLEILVGARSVVAPDITQIVQIQSNEENKFLRVLAILGKTSAEDPNAKFLIFVDRQESADTMMENLMKRGYPCLSLHGGKDQADRDSVISDFKDNTANILIATSVAARGLDVKDLKVVINFDCPNHLEDYVHRCGRTGRAGNKGTAYTFILPNQAQYAMEIVRALTSSNAPVPHDVQALADKHGEKVKRGVARIGGGGFGGRGLGRLEGDRDSVRRIQLKGYGGELGEAAIEEDKPQPKFDKTGEVIIEPKTMHPDIKPISAKDAEKVQATSTDKTMAKAIAAAKERAERLNAMSLEERTMSLAQNIAAERVALSRVQTTAAHWNEVEINDYPHKVRLKIGAKDQITRISAVSNAAITSRGIYVQPGKRPPPGERKLYLFIEADYKHCVDRAMLEIKELLIEAMAEVGSDERPSGNIGRYSVI